MEVLSEASTLCKLMKLDYTEKNNHRPSTETLKPGNSCNLFSESSWFLPSGKTLV